MGHIRPGCWRAHLRGASRGRRPHLVQGRRDDGGDLTIEPRQHRDRPRQCLLPVHRRQGLRAGQPRGPGHRRHPVAPADRTHPPRSTPHSSAGQHPLPCGKLYCTIQFFRQVLTMFVLCDGFVRPRSSAGQPWGVNRVLVRAWRQPAHGDPDRHPDPHPAPDRPTHRRQAHSPVIWGRPQMTNPLNTPIAPITGPECSLGVVSGLLNRFPRRHTPNEQLQHPHRHCPDLHR